MTVDGTTTNDTTIMRADAARIVEVALMAVFDPAVVARLREDSPLVAVGVVDADWVCIADALAESARSAHHDFVLRDTDVDDVVTIGDLIDIVQGLRAPKEGS